MQAETHFSWLREVMVPALFTVLGVVLGFVTSQVRGWWKARQAKKSFLRAVGMELDALGIQLDASFSEAAEAAERVKNGGTGARFAGNLRTAVFDGQIGKLRDVDDPMMIEIIHFYSDLGMLEQIYESVKDADAEYIRTTSDVQRPAIQGRLLSALRVLQQQISGFSKRLKTLRAKLPPAEQHK